jgi:hypothetical protein
MTDLTTPPPTVFKNFTLSPGFIILKSFIQNYDNERNKQKVLLAFGGWLPAKPAIIILF